MCKVSKRSPRLDVDIYNESRALFVSNAKLREGFCDSNDRIAAAIEQRQLVTVALDQDDGFIARVVLGKLSAKEKGEWVGRVSRRLDLTDGKLVVSGGNGYLTGLDDEFYSIIGVPKGEYFVTVYQQMPSVNGSRITQLPGWKGTKHYYESTRSKSRTMPKWLAMFAIDEDESASFDEEDDDLWVQFVIQLEPDKSHNVESAFEYNGSLKSEWRIPDKCPLGIAAVGIEREYEDCDDDGEAGQALKDDVAVAKLFAGIAPAIAEGDYGAVEAEFVPALQPTVSNYLSKRIDYMRHKANVELSCPVPKVNKTWYDGEPATTSLPRWQTVFEDNGNLFDRNSIDEKTYLGEVRNELGKMELYLEGEIDLYMMVDLIIAQTSDGPKVAGVSIY